MPSNYIFIKIKKYHNRRLHNTINSNYITSKNLSCLIKQNSHIKVTDVKTGEDLTHFILTQIILEQQQNVYELPKAIHGIFHQTLYSHGAFDQNPIRPI